MDLYSGSVFRTYSGHVFQICIPDLYYEENLTHTQNSNVKISENTQHKTFETCLKTTQLGKDLVPYNFTMCRFGLGTHIDLSTRFCVGTHDVTVRFDLGTHDISVHFGLAEWKL